MSTEKNGITEWASKDDGAFKRQVSSFRDQIEEGGKFAPEKGECGAASDARRGDHALGKKIY
jgi:putative glutathione S-transferase